MGKRSRSAREAWAGVGWGFPAPGGRARGPARLIPTSRRASLPACPALAGDAGMPGRELCLLAGGRLGGVNAVNIMSIIGLTYRERPIGGDLHRLDGDIDCVDGDID